MRIGDVVMQVYPAENPELVPEIQGPFYEGAQVGLYKTFLKHGRLSYRCVIGYTQTLEMDHAERQGNNQPSICDKHTR